MAKSIASILPVIIFVFIITMAGWYYFFYKRYINKRLRQSNEGMTMPKHIGLPSDESVLKFMCVIVAFVILIMLIRDVKGLKEEVDVNNANISTLQWTINNLIGEVDELTNREKADNSMFSYTNAFFLGDIEKIKESMMDDSTTIKTDVKFEIVMKEYDNDTKVSLKYRDKTCNLELEDNKFVGTIEFEINSGFDSANDLAIVYVTKGDTTFSEVIDFYL